MYEYAFVGYLDYEVEAKFNKIWSDLSENKITQYGVENKGKKPHITIADYSNLNENKFIELLNKFYEDKPKLDISLDIIGTFINTGTLFIAPTLTSELLDFHRGHHNYFKSYDEEKNSLYSVDNWSPHCTVASRLNEENMLQAFRYCKNNIKKMNATLNKVALIQIEINEEGIAIEDTVIFSKELK